MSHMVIFRTPEGKPGYQPAETVQDAVAVVERLRNDEGVENVRIFRLEELSFEYRPYYKVELAGEGAASTGGAAVPPALDEGVGAVAGADPAGETDEGEAVDPAGEPEVVSPDAFAAPGEVDAGGSGAQGVERHPWAAPPPPPPGPPPGGSVFGAGAADDVDELSGTSQRRGLFGR